MSGLRTGAAARAKQPVAQVAVHTTDPDAASSYLAHEFRDQRRREWGRATPFAFDFERLQAGPLGLATMRQSVPSLVELDAGDTLLVLDFGEGREWVATAGADWSVGPGDSLLLPSFELLIEREAGSLEIVTVSSEEVLCRTGAASAFLGGPPVSAAMGAHWLATVAYVRRHVLAAGVAEEHPLLLPTGIELLIAAALAAFPRTTPPVTARAPGPRSVRRALEYIEANAHLDITLRDVADAAGVSTRAIQYGFRRHVGCTPLAHLRHVRLERAHDELRAAERGDGTRVIDVALRWGFENPGRFASIYRARYGALPSETLRGS